MGGENPSIHSLFRGGDRRFTTPSFMRLASVFAKSRSRLCRFTAAVTAGVEFPEF